MSSIFLSYSRNDDEAFVRRLHDDLTNAGFDVWFDRVSMPSRQLTFHQEIRDAIAARDRLLLVVGPGVLTSDYVTQEWRFAYFEAGKCVNPIVRLNGRGAGGATHASQGIDGYELIPEDLKLLHAEDFRDDAQYGTHLANLIRQLSEAIPPVGKLVAVPELPACFLAQPDRIKALRDLLLVDLQKPVVVSGAAARVGLQGMGGIGKSVLASALAHRPEVRRAFPDGIFWITLGQKPQLAEQQRWLARELGDEALFPDERSGKECLRTLLAGRKALLVLDDVWQREDAEAFNVIGAMGRILLTTRDAGLVTALASNETHYRVELPTEAEAEGILAAAAQPKPGQPASAINAEEVREIVAQCGRLPLALALCGGMVQGGVSPADVLEALREHDLEFLSDRHSAEEQHQNAWKAMDVSLRVLPPEQRDRFAELAVFALDRGAPEAAVVTLWEHTGGLAPRHARKLLAEFAARSLVQLTPVAEGDQNGARMSLHDLLHNFGTGMAERQFGSLAALHQTLLDAYRKKCPSDWPSGPDDGCFFQNLCQHLLAAGKLDDAVALLIDLPWIEAKCKAKLVFSLQDDYRITIATMPEAHEGLRRARKSQARLARWTEEITAYSHRWSERRERLARGEVVGEPEPLLPAPPATCRMWMEEEIETERQRITVNPTRLDRMRAFAIFVQQECYSLLKFGTRPSFVLQHAFNTAPKGPVHQIAESFLFGVREPVLTRHWFDRDQYNPKPALLRTLEGHADDVNSVSVTLDGKRAVSGSDDKGLRVWDLENGACLRILEGHTGRVKSVSVTPDGKRAVSGGDDRTLRVWDLESGVCLRTLEGHTDWVLSVSVTPDGKRAVSGSDDETLRMWDLEGGDCLRSLEGHSGGVESVSVTPDGKRAISGGSDMTLLVWDLESGDCLHTLEGHTHGVSSVSVTPDGKQAVSGSWDNMLRVWDLKSGACLRTLEGHTGWVRSVSVTPDGKRTISGSDDDTLRVWDLESGDCLHTLEGHTSEVSSLGVTPDGKRAVSGNWDDALRVWDMENGACLRTLEGHVREVNSVSVMRGGKRAVSMGDDDTLRVWDLESGDCLHTLEGRTLFDQCVNTTPHGKLAISVRSDDGMLRVWDLESGACLLILEGRALFDKCVSTTPDGKRAISGSFNKTLRVWDLENGVCLRTLDGHAGLVSCVSVTPDGNRAVSGSWDNTLRVWDLGTGLCLALTCLPGPVNSVALSSKRGQVITSVSTGQVLQFDLRGMSLTAASRTS
jgi:WD40 repeat protein